MGTKLIETLAHNNILAFSLEIFLNSEQRWFLIILPLKVLAQFSSHLIPCSAAKCNCILLDLNAVRADQQTTVLCDSDGGAISHYSKNK